MDWDFIVTTIASFILGGGIIQFINWKSTKKKGHEEARSAEAQADAINITNAKEIIEMYKNGIKDLTELHERQQEEQERKYNALEKRVAAEQKALIDKITKLEESNRLMREKYATQLNELQSKYDEVLSVLKGSCGTCEFFDSCAKRIKYGIKK